MQHFPRPTEAGGRRPGRSPSSPLLVIVVTAAGLETVTVVTAAGLETVTVVIAAGLETALSSRRRRAGLRCGPKLTRPRRAADALS